MPILCLDFDGVIHSYSSGWKGARNIPDPPVPGALAFMAEALDAGWDVVIHSSRARHWGGISAMRAWLKDHAGTMFYDSPAGFGLERIRFARWKPSAFITIDDRALTFDGTWPSLDTLKAFKPWNKPRYLITDDGKSIICTRCGAKSYNLNDVAQRYCSQCKRFHEEPACG